YSCQASYQCLNPAQWQRNLEKTPEYEGSPNPNLVSSHPIAISRGQKNDCFSES
ncbi:hypothetical protein CEXT_282751, partial [Caerostris extrusa]